MFWFSVVLCHVLPLSEILPLSTFFRLLSLCACGHLLHFLWDDRPALFSWAFLLWLSSGHCSLGLEKEGALSPCPCCSSVLSVLSPGISFPCCTCLPLSQWEVASSPCPCLAWLHHSCMFSSLYFLLHRELNPTSFLFSLCPVSFFPFFNMEVNVICVFSTVCRNVGGGPRLKTGSTVLHLIYWGRVSHLNPELTNSATGATLLQSWAVPPTCN